MAQLGYAGILDWTGIPVGQNGACGYLGIVDWTGIPCGLFETPTTDEGTGSFPVPYPRKRKKTRKVEDEELLLLLLEEAAFEAGVW